MRFNAPAASYSRQTLVASQHVFAASLLSAVIQLLILAAHSSGYWSTARVIFRQAAIASMAFRRSVFRTVLSKSSTAAVPNSIRWRPISIIRCAGSVVATSAQVSRTAATFCAIVADAGKVQLNPEGSAREIPPMAGVRYIPRDNIF